MPDTYDYITLLCRLKAAQTRIKELESGERYIHLQELHQKEYMAYERKLRRAAQDLAAARRETIRVRNYWFQVLEDMQRELEQAKRKAEQELKKMEKRALDAEKQRDDALDKAKEIRLQYYETAAELEEECENKEPENFRVPEYNPENWDFAVHSSPMLKMIWKVCGWEENQTYRSDGVCYKEHRLVEFDLEQAEILSFVET